MLQAWLKGAIFQLLSSQWNLASLDIAGNAYYILSTHLKEEKTECVALVVWSRALILNVLYE